MSGKGFVGNGSWIETFHQGLELFEVGELEATMEEFERSDHSKNGEDSPSQKYMEKCRHLLRNDTPGDDFAVWDICKERLT
ncbi:MAG: hypothetical protein ABEJ65_12560 [bacterium]